MRTGNRKSFFAVCFFAATTALVITSQVRYAKDHFGPSFSIAWDVYGYYNHLPATLIHHDPGVSDSTWFNVQNRKYQKSAPIYQWWEGQNGRKVDAYPIGCAIAWTPFFLVAHASAWIMGYPVDGFSPPYQVMIYIAGFFYGLLGMIFLRKVLLRFVSDGIAAFTILLIGFGTNFFHYGTYDATMPHIVIFPFDVLILWLTIKWHEEPKKITAFLIGFLIALVTVARPSELVWLVIPLLWMNDRFPSLKEKFRFLLHNFCHVLLLVTGMIIPASLQLFYWKYTSGHWLSYNHNEGFDFLHPFTWQVLFSYKKGWLLYTPLMIFSIIGIFMLVKWNRKLFLPVIVFFLLNLYVISSWECWWYAASFGQRPFVQSYGLMAVPLALLIHHAVSRKWYKWILNGSFIFCLVLNQFQEWQFMHGIIDPSRMTERYYWKVFGKTVITENETKYLEIDRSVLPSQDELQKHYTHRTLSRNDFESSGNVPLNYFPIDTFGYESRHCGLMNDQRPLGFGMHARFDSLCSSDHLVLKFECDLFIREIDKDKPVVALSSMISQRHQVYCYLDKRLNGKEYIAGEWNHVECYFITPFILHDRDQVLLNLWDNGGGEVFFDNVIVTGYFPHDD